MQRKIITLSDGKLLVFSEDGHFWLSPPDAKLVLVEGQFEKESLMQLMEIARFALYTMGGE